MANTTGLVWLSDDLRLHDNALINRAAQECKQLIFCYFVDPRQLKQDQYGCQALGLNRRQFLAESLQYLSDQLVELEQRLNIFISEPVSSIEAICSNLPVTHIYRSKPVAFNESQDWLRLRSSLPGIHCVSEETRCLFNARDLEIMGAGKRFNAQSSTDTFPKTFSKFRRLAERCSYPVPTQVVTSLPPNFSLKAFNFEPLNPALWIVNDEPYARGGEIAGLDHLQTYMSSDAPNQYKSTRNTFDSWEESSKWSLWLANGALSVREIAQALRNFQAMHGKNEENDWLMFELLWREYFQWYARAFNKKLFLLNGIANKKQHRGSFYAQRFRQWCNGTTPYPVVNACMRQLNATGYMSNRGRQIAASALIHELGLDWRCGAAYFEQQLIDYDPASNWGNWQYIAGVGADPRGGRQFNLEKQTKMYDPDGAFINRWTNPSDKYPLDYVDAADWPIA